MLIRTLSVTAALSLAVVASRPLAAQGLPVPRALPPLEVVQLVNTPDERLQVREVVARLQSRFADESFVKQVDAARARRDLAAEAKLVADVVGVRPQDIVIAQKVRTSVVPAAGWFRLASWNGAGATRNPWYVIVSVGGRVYCASTSADTCKTALKQMGVASPEVLW